MSANLLSVDDDAQDQSVECLARMLEIAKTLMDGAVDAAPSHAQLCRNSAREIQTTIERLLAESRAFDGRHRQILSETARLDERLAAFGH